jgi:hypothetical protein
LCSGAAGITNGVGDDAVSVVKVWEWADGILVLSSGLPMQDDAAISDKFLTPKGHYG